MINTGILPRHELSFFRPKKPFNPLLTATIYETLHKLTILETLHPMVETVQGLFADPS